MIPIEEIKMYLGTGLKLISENGQLFTIDHLKQSELYSLLKKPIVRPINDLFSRVVEYKSKKATVIAHLTSKNFNYLDLGIYENGMKKGATSLGEDFTIWTDNFNVKSIVLSHKILNSSFMSMQILCDLHYDVFGWIERGLAEEIKD
jgi:hypothetical protein